jgi:hypothetical protein
VEVNPVLDRENQTGKLAVELAASAPAHASSNASRSVRARRRLRRTRPSRRRGRRGL